MTWLFMRARARLERDEVRLRLVQGSLVWLGWGLRGVGDWGLYGWTLGVGINGWMDGLVRHFFSLFFP